MNPVAAFIGPRLTRTNVATLLMLGGGIVMTVGVATALGILAYQPMPGPEIAAVARIDGIAKIGLVCAAFAGSVLIVLGLIVLNIDKASFSAGMVSGSIDRAEEPKAPLVETTTTTKVTTPSPEDEA